jgi:hypothetical protein
LTVFAFENLGERKRFLHKLEALLATCAASLHVLAVDKGKDMGQPLFNPFLLLSFQVLHCRVEKKIFENFRENEKLCENYRQNEILQKVMLIKFLHIFWRKFSRKRTFSQNKFRGILGKIC